MPSAAAALTFDVTPKLDDLDFGAILPVLFNSMEEYDPSHLTAVCVVPGQAYLGS